MRERSPVWCAHDFAFPCPTNRNCRRRDQIWEAGSLRTGRGVDYGGCFDNNLKECPWIERHSSLPFPCRDVEQCFLLPTPCFLYKSSRQKTCKVSHCVIYHKPYLLRKLATIYVTRLAKRRRRLWNDLPRIVVEPLTMALPSVCTGCQDKPLEKSIVETFRGTIPLSSSRRWHDFATWQEWLSNCGTCRRERGQQVETSLLSTALIVGFCVSASKD